jgi:hypothetical protein
VNVEGKTILAQFGVYTFVYRHGVEVLVQAQKNKWALPWIENWFYVRLEGEPGLCGKLMRLDSVTSKGIMTDACATVVDALKDLLCHLCAHDLVKEFVCEKVLPLREN